MNGKNHTVYFNAIKTEQGIHLLAVGWTNCAGCIVNFTPVENTNNFNFTVSKPDGVSAQVLTPFQIAIEVPEAGRSITVFDGIEYQIQVNEIIPCENGKNEGGKWVMPS